MRFKIDKAFSIDLPLSSLFECLTIESLARHIDKQVAGTEIDFSLYTVEEF